MKPSEMLTKPGDTIVRDDGLKVMLHEIDGSAHLTMSETTDRASPFIVDGELDNLPGTWKSCDPFAGMVKVDSVIKDERYALFEFDKFMGLRKASSTRPVGTGDYVHVHLPNFTEPELPTELPAHKSLPQALHDWRLEEGYGLREFANMIGTLPSELSEFEASVKNSTKNESQPEPPSWIDSQALAGVVRWSNSTDPCWCFTINGRFFVIAFCLADDPMAVDLVTDEHAFTIDRTVMDPSPELVQAVEGGK